MNERIMIVDDDPAVRYTVQEVLRGANLSAIAVESGRACLEELRNGFRGVILLDIMMPEMDGWDTLEAMKREGLSEGNIVCMLTAVISPSAELETLKDDVLDYVRKPFDPDGLIATAKEYLSYLRTVPEGDGYEGEDKA
ncbi:MAG: response regulator [Phycisphaerae bacterium]|nr:response regulator [Phycisphaerae bacterium]